MEDEGTKDLSSNLVSENGAKGREGDNDERMERSLASTSSASDTPSSYDMESTAQREQDELAALSPFKIYNPPSSQPSSLASIGATLPDNSDYFKPTMADLKLAQDSLAHRAKLLQDAPLLTAKLRNEKEEEKRNRFPNTTIRVKFANRTMLEKSFPSSEKIISVYRFVRGCLSDDARAHKFVLFLSPPRRDLKVSDPEIKDKSLFELRLTPQSNLFFRFLDDSIALDSPTSPPPLLPALFVQCINLPDPIIPPVTNSDPQLTNAGSSLKNSSTERKVPKWLKFNKKTL